MSDAQEAIPAILYKYRDWSERFHRKLITDLEVFFSPPEHFNDSFDAGHCEAPAGAPTNDALVERLQAQMPGVPIADIQALAAAITQEPSPQYEHDVWGSILLRFAGVLSLSASPLELPMWSQYSNNHQGFCVGLSSHGLLADCHDAGVKIECCPIDYVDERPDFSEHDFPAKELLKLHLTTKQSAWSYEREYRFMGHFTDAPRTLQLSSLTVMEVLLGYRMLESQRAELIEALMPVEDVLIRQVKRNRQSLKLEVVSLGMSQNQHRGPEFKCTPTFSAGADVHCMIVCPMCSTLDTVVIPFDAFPDLPHVQCQRCGLDGHVFIVFQ